MVKLVSRAIHIFFVGGRGKNTYGDYSQLFGNHRDSWPRANDGPIQLPFPMQLNYLAMASCVTVKSKQLGRILGESWAAWTTKHMTFHGRIFCDNFQKAGYSHHTYVCPSPL